MRILLVTPMPPQAKAPGAIPLVLHAQLCGLRERHQVSLVTVAGQEPGERQAIADLRESGLDIYALMRQEPHGWLQRWQRRWRLGSAWLAQWLPWRTVWFWEPGLQQILDRVLVGGEYDLVLVEDNAMGIYNYPTDTPLLFTEHEVRRPRKVNWEIREGQRLASWAFTELDWQRWPAYQRHTWQKFDHLQVFSNRDAQAIREIAPQMRKPVSVNPFAIDLPTPAHPKLEQPGNLLFVGNFTHQPNVDAALWIGHEIMPRLARLRPEIQLNLVGIYPPPAVRALESESVHVMGAVPDLNPYLEAAAVVLAPVRIGGGMRMKVLHSMAKGKAVVTTARGIEGLDVWGTQPPVVIADDAEGITHAVATLLANDKRRRKLGMAARTFVAEQFSPQAYARRVEAIYSQMIAPPEPHLSLAQDRLPIPHTALPLHPGVEGAEGSLQPAGYGLGQTKSRSRHGMPALESGVEIRRNRLLRSVDWRFLTGKPRPRCSVAPEGSSLAQGLELVSGQVLSPDQAIPGSIDLFATINPRRVDLERAWQALEPGGVLYVEWYRPWPGSVAALRRRLEGLGFLLGGSYWPWPWPGRSTPAFWLPLEAPEALSHFLKTRPSAHSLPARSLRQTLQIAWRLLERTRLLVPACMVAYKPVEGTHDAELPPASLPALAQRWGISPRGERLDWLLLTGGLHSTNKVTALVFHPGSTEPAYAVKMPRSELSIPSLKQEATALQEIQRHRSQPLPGVPKLAYLSEDGFPAVVETHLAGVPLYTAMGSQPLDSLAQRATRWLLELVAPGPPRPPEEWKERLVAPLLEQFQRRYEQVGGVAFLNAIRGELDHLGPLQRAIEHRDFSPWNIFHTPSGDLSVLDWEAAESDGLPYSDLIYFLANLTFFAERALEADPAVAVYRRMLAGQSRMGVIASACTQEYCTGAGLDPAALRPLRILTWMRHAVPEHELIRRSSAGQPDEQLLQRGRYLSLLRAELEMPADG